MKKYRNKLFKVFAFISVFLALTISLCSLTTSCSFAINNVETSSNILDSLVIPDKIYGRSEKIIKHTGYTVSYNKRWKIPNWVAYELTYEKMQGTVKRKDNFCRDPFVPARYSAKQSDYSHSGWDRGHMVPAGDMKWSEIAMKETFYFSNICPQNRNLNGGIWHDLERQVRNIAIQKKQVFVICGPIVYDESEVRTIGDSFVFVPDAFFKVLLRKHKGKWHSIAFVFPNEAGKNPLSTYAMSVSDLQEITGIRFFPNMPDSIVYDLKNNVDFRIWNIKGNK